MKIRNGFVSNSSSASYIIDVHNITEEDFYRKCFEYGRWSIFDIRKIEGLLKFEEIEDDDNDFLKELRIKRNEEIQKLKEEFENKKFKEKYDNYFQELEDLKDYIHFVDKIYEPYNNPNIAYAINNNYGTIRGTSVIHNDFGDIPEFVKTISLGFLFEKEYKLTFIMEE